MTEASWSKYAPTDDDDEALFLIWRRTFKMAAMTSFHAEKCYHLVCLRVVSYVVYALISRPLAMVGLVCSCLRWQHKQEQKQEGLTKTSLPPVLTTYRTTITIRPTARYTTVQSAVLRLHVVRSVRLSVCP